MSGENYRYDDSLGIHGWQSKNLLGSQILDEFQRYEQNFRTENARSLSASVYGLADPLISELRLSTLVAADEPTGYALAAAQSHDPNYRGIESIFYAVDLSDDPVVTESKNLFITSSALLTRKTAREMEIVELTKRFNKVQLEAISRLARKLVTGFAYEETILENDEPAPNAHYQARAISDTIRKREVIARAVSIEPRVLRALQHYNLDHLSTMFPGLPSPIIAPTHEEAAQTENRNKDSHILEWQEFITAAQGYFRRESDQHSRQATAAIQYLKDDDHYVMRFHASYGELIKIQLLCHHEATESWQTQEFDLQVDSHEDDIDRLRINDAWDASALLESAQQGTPITDKMYSDYVRLAATDPRTPIPLAEVVDLKVVRKKRRAA